MIILHTHLFLDFECSTCSSSWFRLDNKQWFLIGSEAMDQAGAVQFCVQNGGSLAKIKSGH